MSFYPDPDSFYQVMQRLFERLSTNPGATAQFQRAKMAIRFRCTEPQAELLIDGRSNPIRVETGPQPGRTDLDLTMTADTLHDVWLGKVRLRDAFSNGQIRVSGNVFRAMQLADLFREAEAAYPQVLRELGYSV
ncbi:MAG: SCP2 sterol-binding domain-containing protein [Anaerolineae bacterium]